MQISRSSIEYVRRPSGVKSQQLWRNHAKVIAVKKPRTKERNETTMVDGADAAKSETKKLITVHNHDHKNLVQY